MPTASEAEARQWIEARSRENPQAVAASTLAEQRKEKIRLECALLSLRLQREQDNTELLPTAECLVAIRAFCRLALISLKQRIDSSAERVAACQTPNTIHPCGQLAVEFFFVQSSKCAGRVIHQPGQS